MGLAQALNAVARSIGPLWCKCYIELLSPKWVIGCAKSIYP